MQIAVLAKSFDACLCGVARLEPARWMSAAQMLREVSNPKRTGQIRIRCNAPVSFRGQRSTIRNTYEGRSETWRVKVRTLMTGPNSFVMA